MGTKALEQGDLKMAEQYLDQAIIAGDRLPQTWNNIAVLYSRQGHKDLARDAYTLAARYGNPTSQKNLIKNGWPVPPADLVQQQIAPTTAADGTSGATAALEILSAGVQGWNAGRASATPLNCTTIRLDKDYSNTTCR